MNCSKCRPSPAGLHQEGDNRRLAKGPPQTRWRRHAGIPVIPTAGGARDVSDTRRVIFLVGDRGSPATNLSTGIEQAAFARHRSRDYGRGWPRAALRLIQMAIEDASLALLPEPAVIAQVISEDSSMSVPALRWLSVPRSTSVGVQRRPEVVRGAVGVRVGADEVVDALHRIS